MRKAGRHFLQIPGPTNLPDRVLRAMDRPVIDHRGPEFAELALKAFAALKTIVKTDGHVIIYPSSGTGAWEAALQNTLSPGDKVLMHETGHFATLWKVQAEQLGLEPVFMESDWRSGVDPDVVEDLLRRDTNHEIKAVCIVHNETSNGTIGPAEAVRRAIDAANHPALYMVDTISSLASAPYEHDGWGVDVTVGGSQKGLMLPPGLAFTAISDKALEASKRSTLPKSYFRWSEMLGPNAKGFFPYTPPTNLFYGLVEAVDMLHEEGLENVFARHARHGAATRAAVRAWGLETVCNRQGHESPSVTAVFVPEGSSADNLRKVALEQYDMALGSGLARLADRVFRIGHLGDFNDLMLMGALSGVEMALEGAGVPHQKGGAQAAMAELSAGHSANGRIAA